MLKWTGKMLMTNDIINSILEDIDHALMANNGGGLEFKQSWCKCDISVDMICEYCTIDNALRRCKAYLTRKKNEQG